ncbi:MAG TPA: hypothetical protein VMB81_28220, partial [Candidatus Sulfotelmatobacter sp.]|nr:hypothetical protein [Candidatus Sulfotelmatobacter sp.]
MSGLPPGLVDPLGGEHLEDDVPGWTLDEVARLQLFPMRLAPFEDLNHSVDPMDDSSGWSFILARCVVHVPFEIRIQHFGQLIAI